MLPELPLAAGRTAPPCETEPCSQCCHDIEMILTEADVGRIALRVAASPSLRKQMDEIGPWHFEAEDGFLQLHTRPGLPARGSPGGSPCWFLGDDGRCRIWDARPEGCRLYPAIWDDAGQEAILDADYCPHTDGFGDPAPMTQATRDLAARLDAELATRTQT